MHELTSIAAIGLLLIAAGCDLRWRIIPDWISLALAGGIVVSVLLGWREVDVLPTLAIASGCFVAGALLFAFGILGGGDVKLFSATVLWIEPSSFLHMVFITAMAGGLLGVLLLTVIGVKQALGVARGQDEGTLERATAAVPTVPYGIAIALGGAAVLSGNA